MTEKDLMKYADSVRVERSIKYLDPKAPASYKQRKYLAKIYAKKELRFQWDSKLTMAEAGKIIDQFKHILDD